MWEKWLELVKTLLAGSEINVQAWVLELHGTGLVAIVLGILIGWAFIRVIRNMGGKGGPPPSRQWPAEFLQSRVPTWLLPKQDR